MSFRTSMDPLNAPFHTLTKTNLRLNDVYVYDKRTNFLAGNFIQVLPNILVQDTLTTLYTDDYFTSSIVNKDVYASLHLYGGYLPTFFPSKYFIMSKGEKPTDTMWAYKKIEFDTEETLGDLYKHSCWFQYNADIDEYIKLPEAGAVQNSLKVYMQKHVYEIGGDPYDRIADLSRIILFLLTKVTLSDEEQSIVSTLLPYAQTASNLADVFNREKIIQEYVASVKADPKGYINKNE